MFSRDLTLSQLIRHFEFEVVDPTHPFDDYNAGLQVQWNMWFRATLRKKSY
jgi:hypothetical protein